MHNFESIRQECIPHAPAEVPSLTALFVFDTNVDPFCIVLLLGAIDQTSSFLTPRMLYFVLEVSIGSVTGDQAFGAGPCESSELCVRHKVSKRITSKRMCSSCSDPDASLLEAV